MATEYVTASRAELSSSSASSGSRASSTSGSAPSSAGSHRNRQLLRSYHDFAMHVFSNSRAAQEGERLFLSAVREGDSDRVENFIKRRNNEVFNIDMKDLSSGDTPLIVACRMGHEKIIQLLLRSGADVTVRNHDSQTAVSAASSTDVLKMLLGSVERGGWSNRHLLQAAWQGNKSIVQQLLGESNSLDVNCENSDGFTPLLLVTRDIAAFEKIQSALESYNPVEVVGILLAHGADPSRGDTEGWTALHHLAACPSLLGHQITLMLVSDQENMFALDEHSSAPVHVASKYGQVGAVVTLLENGTDVNMRGEDGATPLHVSAASGQVGVAHSLLDLGADVTLVDDRGHTPMDVARGKQMRATLKEAWTEATQSRRGSTPDLNPVKPPARRGHRRHSSSEENSPRDLKPLVSTNRVLLKLEDARQALMTESEILRDINNGTFTAGSLARRNAGNHRKSKSPSRAPAPPKTPRAGREPPKTQRSSSFGGRSSSTKVKGQADRAHQQLGYRHSDPTLPREKAAIPITVVGLGWDEEAQDIRLCRLTQSNLLPQRRANTDPEISKRVTFDLSQHPSLQQITDVCSGYLNRGPRSALTSDDAVPSLPAVSPNRPLSGAYKSSFFNAIRGPGIPRLQGELHGPGPPAELVAPKNCGKAIYRQGDQVQRCGRKPKAPYPGTVCFNEPLFREDDHFRHTSASLLEFNTPHQGAANTFHIEATRVSQLKESSDSGQGSTRSTNSRASTSSSLSSPSPLLGDIEGSPSRHQGGSRRSLHLQSFDSDSGIHLPSITREGTENQGRAERVQALDGPNFKLMNHHLRHHSDDAMSVVSVTSTATSKTADICGQRISLSHTLIEESESGATPEQTLRDTSESRCPSDVQGSSASGEVVRICQTDDEKLANADWEGERNVRGQDALIGMEVANHARMRRLDHQDRSRFYNSQEEFPGGSVVRNKGGGRKSGLSGQQDRNGGDTGVKLLKYNPSVTKQISQRKELINGKACLKGVGQAEQSVLDNSVESRNVGEVSSKMEKIKLKQQGVTRNGSIPLPTTSRVKVNMNGITGQEIEKARTQKDVGQVSEKPASPIPSPLSGGLSPKKRDGAESVKAGSSMPTAVTSEVTSDPHSRESGLIESVGEGFAPASSPPEVDGEVDEHQLRAAFKEQGKPLTVLDPAVVLTRSEVGECCEENVEERSPKSPDAPRTNEGVSAKLASNRKTAPGQVLGNDPKGQDGKRVGKVTEASPVREMKLGYNPDQEWSQAKDSIPTDLRNCKIKDVDGKLSGDRRTETLKPQDVESKLNGSPEICRKVNGSSNGKGRVEDVASAKRNSGDDGKDDGSALESMGTAVVADSSPAVQQTPVIVDIREGLPKNYILESEKLIEHGEVRNGAAQSKSVARPLKEKKKLTLNLGHKKVKGSPKSSPAVTKSPKKVKSPSKVSGSKGKKKDGGEGPKSPKKTKKKKKSINKRPGENENWRLVSDVESNKTAFITGQGWEIRTSRNESDDVIIHHEGSPPSRMDDLTRTIANIMSPLEANTPKFLPDTMGTIKEFAGTLSATRENEPKDVFTFSPIESPVASRSGSQLNTPKYASPKTPGSSFFPEITPEKNSPLISSVVQTGTDSIVASETPTNADLPKVFQLSDDCDSTDSSPQKNTSGYSKVEVEVPTRVVVYEQMPPGARRAIQEKRGSLHTEKLTSSKFGLTRAQRKVLKRRTSVPTQLTSSEDEDSSDMESLASSLRRRFLADIRDTTSEEYSTDEGNNSSRGVQKYHYGDSQAAKFAAAIEKLDDEYRDANPPSLRMAPEDRNDYIEQEEGDGLKIESSEEGSGRTRVRRVAVVRKETTPVQWLTGIDETDKYGRGSTRHGTQRGRVATAERVDIHEEESSPKEKLFHEHVQTISIRNLQEFNSILTNSEGVHITSPLAPTGSSVRLSARPSSRESQVSRGVMPASLNQSLPMSEVSEQFDLKQESRLSEELCCTRGTNPSSSAASGDRSQSQSTNRSESEGEMLHWKKGNVLGKGAFGTVYCGLTSTGQLVAVKQVDQLTCKRQAGEQYEKLQEEVELLKTLRHKNIVGFLGVSLEDTVVNIFMQYIPGGSIASLLARFGALEEAVFCRYTNQVIQGTVYLHSNSVIHRDIKGANIMLMSNGIIKLIDFGCAKRLCIQRETQNLLRSMKGTPYWMAPEVIMEIGHGAKSDVWSVGCTVIEMATRKPPWADMPPMSAIFAIGSGETVPQLGEKFSASARDFVNICLTRNPDDRATSTELLRHPFLTNRKERSKESRRISRISLSNFEEGIMFKEEPIRKDSVEKPKRRIFDFE